MTEESNGFFVDEVTDEDAEDDVTFITHSDLERARAIVNSDRYGWTIDVHVPIEEVGYLVTVTDGDQSIHVWNFDDDEVISRERAQRLGERMLRLRREVSDAIDLMFNEKLADEQDKTDCKFYCGSVHLKCAVNPKGNCASCSDYEVKSDD